jgi:hypothetical protein
VPNTLRAALGLAIASVSNNYVRLMQLWDQYREATNNSRYLWFKCSIAIGLLLSVLLLIETLVTYRYVERDLVREEAQREASRRVR